MKTSFIKFTTQITILLALLVQSGHSQTTYVWTNLVAGVVTGGWDNPLNWSPNGLPKTGDNANFSTLDITAVSTISLNGNQTNANLIFGDVVANNNWTVDASGTLTLESAFASPTINVSNQTATLQAVILGGQGFTKLGAGTLVLSGANTYSGNTTNSAGTLTIASTGSGTADVPTSGPFGVSPLVLAAGTLNVAAGGGIIYNSVVVLTGDTVAMGTTVTSVQLSLGGSISGGGTINESGNQTAGTHLSGTNSAFTGTFNSTGNGSHRMRFDNANSGSAAAIWNLNNNNTDGYGLAFGNGTLYFGVLQGGGNMRSDGAGGTVGVLQIGDLNIDSTWSGTINANGTSVIAINKVGTGKLIFSGNNGYNGFTTISNGVLQLGAAGAAGMFNSTLVTNYSKLVFSYNRADTFAFPATLVTGTGSLSFTNVGTGIMTLAGTDNESGDTIIAAGTIRLLSRSALPGGPGAGNLILNGTLDVFSNSIAINGLSGAGVVDNTTNAAAVTLTVGSNDVTSAFSGIIKNTGAALSLVKAGAGKITLSGPNTYTGTTTVNGGELDIVTTQTGGGAITVSSGSTFGVVVNNASSVPTSTLTASNTSALSFSGISSTTIALLNATNLAPDGVVTVNVAGSFVSGGQYPLIKFSNYTGTGGFVLGTLPAGTTANLVTNGGFIKLNVTVATPLVWKGNVSTNWDIATTANWTQGASATTYADGQTVQFNDTATTGNVNLSANVTPAGVLVTNNSLAYTFNSASGSAITGTAALTKQGGGTLTLSGLANTYSGITTVNGGTVAIGADNNLGNNGGIVLNGGALSAASSLTLNASRSVAVGPASGSGTGTLDAASGQTLTFNGVIGNNLSGTGSLTKTGNGTLVLGGANTYSGSTLVSGGTLSLTAAQQGGGSITVNNGMTLSVSRTGGTMLPASSLTLGSGGATTLQLGNLNTASAVITATNLTTSGTVTVSILTGVPALGEVPLIRYNTLGGAGFSAFSLASLPAGVTAVLTNDAANKVVGLFVANVAALTWTGTNGTTWDIVVTTNWQYLGANVMFQAGSAVVLDDTAFTNQLNLTTTAGVFNMVVTNNTLTYTLNGNGSLSGPMTLTKTGTGTLIKANLGSDAYTGGTIVQQGVLDVRSSTALGSGVVTLAGGTLANRGATPVSPTNTIFAQTNTTSTLQTSGASDLDLGNITGSGNLVAVNTGGGFGIIGLNGDNSGFTGTITVNNAADMRFAFLTPGAGSANAKWVLNSTGTDNQKFTFGTGTVSFGSLSGNGQLRNDGGASTVTLSVGALNLNSTFTGLIVANGTAQFALTKVGTGTFTLAGNQTFTGQTEVAGGTLLISTAQTTAKNYVVDDGVTLGFNNVGGQAALTSLTVGTNAGASLLFTNVSDTGTAPANVSGAGGLMNNGTCTIKLADTNNLVVGNSYPLVQYSTYSGSGSFALSAPAGFAGTVTNDTSVSQVILIVSSSVNTSPTNLTSIVNNGNLELSWPADHTGWHLQAQTNSLTTGLDTSWVTIPGTDLGNSYTNAIEPANGTVFYRMVYP